MPCELMNDGSDTDRSDWRGHAIEFRVASDGSLWLADFDEPTTRAEVYEVARDE